MWYGIFLLALEGGVVYFLSVYTSVLALYPHAILWAYLLVSLLAFFTPGFRSWRYWWLVFLLNLALVLGIFAFLFYGGKRYDTYSTNSGEFSSKTRNYLVSALFPPAKDQRPFLASLQNLVLKRYDISKRFARQMMPGSTRNSYETQLRIDESSWSRKVQTLFARYPSLRKSFASAQKGSHEEFQKSLMDLSLTPVLKEFLDWSQNMQEFSSNFSSLETAMVKKHFELVSRSKVLLPTLAFLPQTVRTFPVLLQDTGFKPKLSTLDIFILQNGSSSLKLPNPVIRLRKARNTLLAENYFYDANTNLLLLENPTFNGQKFVVAKVFTDSLFLFSKGRSKSIRFSGIRKAILSYDPPTKNLFASHWFSRSYIKENRAYYKKNIYTPQKKIFSLFIGFWIATLLVGITGLAFRPLAKISRFSWILGVFFSFFLSYLYYHLVWVFVNKALIFWF